MIDAITNDIVNSTLDAFHGSEMAYLALLGLAVLLIGLRCNSFTHLFSHALEAMILSATLFALYSIAWPQSDAPANANAWSRALANEWETIMAFSVQRLLGFYVLALLGLAAIFLIKQFITRR